MWWKAEVIRHWSSRCICPNLKTFEFRPPSETFLWKFQNCAELVKRVKKICYDTSAKNHEMRLNPGNFAFLKAANLSLLTGKCWKSSVLNKTSPPKNLTEIDHLTLNSKAKRQTKRMNFVHWRLHYIWKSPAWNCWIWQPLKLGKLRQTSATPKRKLPNFITSRPVMRLGLFPASKHQI